MIELWCFLIGVSWSCDTKTTGGVSTLRRFSGSACRCCAVLGFFFCKQKTAYEMRISDWSSDVCSSDLFAVAPFFKGDPIPPITAFTTQIFQGAELRHAVIQLYALEQAGLLLVAQLAQYAHRVFALGAIADRKSTRLNSSH